MWYNLTFWEGGYCILKLSHGNGCLHLEFSLLAPAVRGLLQSQGKTVCSVCIEVMGVVLVTQFKTPFNARIIFLNETVF